MNITRCSRWLHFTLLVLLALLRNSNQTQGQEQHVKNFFQRADSPSGHTNNWAVLVCASRYWFNYRHMANALGMYRTVKRLGIPDSNIILMLADDAACNARNMFPGSVYANTGRQLDLYGDNIEVDYRGYEVTVENFLRVLTGRVPLTQPRSKRLLTDDRSNVFVYLTGHGGNEFLKFQDNEEISAFDIADAFEQMWQKKRYKELFFMVDTCQANTLYSKFYSPNILATGSSEIDENSYSHEADFDIGVAVIDSYTHYVLQYLEGINKTSKATMEDFFAMYDPVRIQSHPGVRSDLFQRPLSSVLVTDFFGGMADVDIVDSHLFHDLDDNIKLGSSPSPRLSNTNRDPSASRPVEGTGSRLLPAGRSHADVHQTRAWAGLGMVGLLAGFVLLQTKFRTASSGRDR
ncbi:peptidase C13 family-domain-containing protein [Gautieria morchelliformis]|nr:peptidase C13 family-domain-containing protein [Gautieria morchelliformis]